MKWWYKLCDKVVEKVSGESNNAGAFGFRIRCLGVWNIGWTLLAGAASVSCPEAWVALACLLPVWYGAIFS